MPCVTRQNVLQKNTFYFWQLTAFQPFWQLVCSDCNHLLPNNITAFNAKKYALRYPTKCFAKKTPFIFAN